MALAIAFTMYEYNKKKDVKFVQITPLNVIPTDDQTVVRKDTGSRTVIAVQPRNPSAGRVFEVLQPEEAPSTNR